MNWLKKIYTTVITVHKRVLCTVGVKLSLLTILNLTGAGRFSTFQKKYLLPGVKLQGGDADLFNLIFSDTKQQVPMRLGGQRYLGKDGIKRLNTSISWTDGQWQWTKKQNTFGWNTVSSHLQSPGSEVYAGTGDGLSLEPHKHIGPQAVVHVVPVRAQRTQEQKHSIFSKQRTNPCY